MFVCLPIHILCAGDEYAHRFPPCCMRRLKECPDDSASTAWDYVSLLCNFYSLDWRDQRMTAQNADTILKLLVSNPHSNPPTHGATCWWLGCTIPLLPSNFSIFLLNLPLFFPLYMLESSAIIATIGQLGTILTSSKVNNTSTKCLHQKNFLSNSFQIARN